MIETTANVDKLKLLIQNMWEQIKFLEKEINNINNRSKDIKTMKDVHQEKYESINSNSESRDTSSMQIDKVNTAKEDLLYCALCVYKCKIKKTMVKHLNTKHKKQCS